MPGELRVTASSGSLVVELAALVVRQSLLVQRDGDFVSGVDAIPGQRHGLTRHDRHAMAEVSRRLLMTGRPDQAAEIHELLALCGRPLGEWLQDAEVEARGLQRVALVDLDAGAPTMEARALAERFEGHLPREEEQLFHSFLAILRRHFASKAPAAYTAIREWVVRHPLCRTADIQGFLADRRLLGPIISAVFSFYEPVPLGWTARDGVPVCAHCGNALQPLPRRAFRCRTQACAAVENPSVRAYEDPTDLLRLKRSMMVFWLNPGFDELRLYDALRTAGQAVALWPDMDAVDLAIDDAGFDMKAYASPEMLASRFETNIGSLAAYRRRALVIPDRLLVEVPHYLQRLRAALPEAARSLECLSASEVLARYAHA